MGNSVQDWKPDENTYGFRDRDRFLITGSDIGSYWSTGGSPNRTIKYASGYQSRMRDVNHQFYHQFMRRRNKNEIPAYRNIDMGHGMALEKVTIDDVPSIHTQQRITNNVRAYYDGVFAPTSDYLSMMQNLAAGNKLSIPSALGTDLLQLWGYGSTAVKKSIPDIPDFSLPRFIGELRQGLPKVPLKALATERKLSSVGGEYLNVQFGIVPTVSDLQKLFQLLMSPRAKQVINRTLDQEFRSRKVIDKGTVITNTDLTGTPQVNSLTANFTSNIKCTRTRTQSYRIWSSCSFRYYQVHQLQQLINDLEKQAGIGFIPNAIDFWNLIPWSWFVDWFTNFNHIVTNLSYLGKDGLYLQRGYIMGHYKDVLEERQSRVYMGTPIESIGKISYERKYRTKASPFGFGLTWKEFDPFQLSILGALGISKLRY